MDTIAQLLRNEKTEDIIKAAYGHKRRNPYCVSRAGLLDEAIRRTAEEIIAIVEKKQAEEREAYRKALQAGIQTNLFTGAEEYEGVSKNRLGKRQEPKKQ